MGHYVTDTFQQTFTQLCVLSLSFVVAIGVPQTVASDPELGPQAHTVTCALLEFEATGLESPELDTALGESSRVWVAPGTG